MWRRCSVGRVLTPKLTPMSPAPAHRSRATVVLVIRVGEQVVEPFHGVTLNLPGDLSVNGDGSAVREYTHVLDVAAAYRLALESTGPGARRVYTVGSGGDGVSVTDLVDAVVDVTGQAVSVENRPPQPEPQLLVADSTRIRPSSGDRRHT